MANETIPLEIAGRNASIETSLRKRIADRSDCSVQLYSDDYLNELDKAHPLGFKLMNQIQQIAVLVSLALLKQDGFRALKCGNYVIEDIIYTSVSERRWQPYIRHRWMFEKAGKNPHEYLKKIKQGNTKEAGMGYIEFSLDRGIKNFALGELAYPMRYFYSAQEEGLAVLSAFQDNFLAIPTEKTVEIGLEFIAENKDKDPKELSSRLK